MQFELNDALINQILYQMENQDAKTDIEGVKLPPWTPNDGYRLMERFTATLKNPLIRGELTQVLNAKTGVFRSFKNVLEQYPETEKLFTAYKRKKMKAEIILWYNSLREEWGLEPIGEEPEDTSSLVLEDFVIRKIDNTDSHNLTFIAENAFGDECGIISCSFKSTHLYINKLEVKDEYRGLGLGKALLSKLLEQIEGKTVCIDVPHESSFFSRALLLEGFKLSSQTFVR